MAKPRKVNVEPLLFLMSFSFGLYSPIHTAFITFKNCLRLLDSSVEALPNPHEYCMQLGSAPPSPKSNSTGMDDPDPYLIFLNKVQAATAQFNIYSQLLSTVPTVLATILIGAWSDVNGRKPPIVVALAGSAIAAQASIVVAAVDSISVYVLLAPTFISSLTGHMIVVIGSAYAMISDATQTSKALTIRIALASGVGSIGSLSAHLISAVILQYWDDYTLIYLCGSVCVTCAFLYAVFGLQETIQFSRKRQPPVDDGYVTNGALVPASGHTNGSADHHGEIPKEDQNGCLAFLHWKRIKESFHVLSRARPGRRRFYLLTTLVSFTMLFSSQPNSVLNLFAKRPPLSFTNSQYSYLTSAGSVMMFAPALFTWLLKTSDICLIVIGVTFAVFKMALTAFSTEKWMLFIALGVGGLCNLEFTGFRSFMTKLVEPTETGRLFATVSAIDHLAPLVSSIAFNTIYAKSLEWFPGFVFLLSAVLAFLVLLVMSYLYFDIRKRNEDLGRVQPSVVIDDTEALIHSEING